MQSLKHAVAQQQALDKRLQQAEKDVFGLNRRGRGRKRRDEAQTRAAVDDILKHHDVTALLGVEYQVETRTTRKRAYLTRPAREVTTVTVSVARDTAAYEDRVRDLGWRVLVCNDPELGLSEAVLAYREEYLVDRYCGKIPGMTPL